MLRYATPSYMEFVEEQRKRPTLSNSGEGVRLETYRFPLASTDGEEKKKNARRTPSCRTMGSHPTFYEKSL